MPNTKRTDGIAEAAYDVQDLVMACDEAAARLKPAVALIEIAHPDLRKHLLDGAIERGLVGRRQEMRSRTAYPDAEVRDVRLRDGREVRLRPTSRFQLIPQILAGRENFCRFECCV